MKRGDFRSGSRLWPDSASLATAGVTVPRANAAVSRRAVRSWSTPALELDRAFAARRAPCTGPAQFWTNCICVPARSMMSPCFSEIDSSPTGCPLTLGRRAPSTWDST